MFGLSLFIVVFARSFQKYGSVLFKCMKIKIGELIVI